MFDSDKAITPTAVAIGAAIFGFMAYRGKKRPSGFNYYITRQTG